MQRETTIDTKTREMPAPSNGSSVKRDRKRDSEAMSNGATANGGGNGAAGEADFAALLAAYEPALPTRGDIVEGVVMKLKGNVAILDIGAKRDAVVPPQEMDAVDESYLISLSVGDSVPVYITETPVGSQELRTYP